MKQFLLALCMISATLCFAQETITVDSKVSSVTIFRDRAMVTREGETKLNKGIHQITFSNLPNEFDDASVRVAAMGNGVIKILDVKVEYKAPVEVTETQKPLILKTLDSLKAARLKIVNQITLLEKKKEMLDLFKAQALKNLNEKLTAGTGQPKEWIDLQKYFQTNQTDILTELRVATREKQQTEDVLNVMERERQMSGGKTAQNSKEVLVTVETAERGNVTFRPSYLIRNAYWSPSYDLRVSSADKKGELHFFGVLRQSSGEDWKNVSLTLSTAEPILLKDIPVLPPWYLGKNPSPNTTGQVYVRGGRSNEARYIVPDEEFNTQLPKVQELSTLFTVPEKYDIPGDNNPHKVEVSVTTLPMVYEFTAIPKVAPKVYLKGKMINTGDYAWLAGDVNVFIDNDYINRTNFDDILPSDTLELALGTDERTTIEKVLVNKYHETKGVFNGSALINYEYEIRITNNGKIDETVLVYDQLPISLHETIKVTPVEPKIEIKDLPGDKKITWTLNLKPGEKKNIPFKFSIEYPASKSIFGLE